MSDTKKRGKKRPKSYYLKCSNQKRRKFPGLESGIRGFLLTCNSHEKDAVREAYSILNEYADQLYGPEEVKPKEEAKEEDINSEDSDSDEDDVDKALQKELKSIKDTALSTERRFKNTQTKANNCIFIKTTLENPNELAEKIFTDLHTSKVQKSCYAIRLLPITETCKAFMGDIEKLSKRILVPVFQTPFGTGLGFSIMFKMRNNNIVTRVEVQTSLGQIIKDLNPLHSVNFTNPDIVVLVEIIGNVCCIGIVKDFFKFKKYNLHEVVKNETAAEDKTLKTEDTKETDDGKAEASMEANTNIVTSDDISKNSKTSTDSTATVCQDLSDQGQGSKNKDTAYNGGNSNNSQDKIETDAITSDSTAEETAVKTVDNASFDSSPHSRVQNEGSAVMKCAIIDQESSTHEPK